MKPNDVKLKLKMSFQLHTDRTLKTRLSTRNTWNCFWLNLNGRLKIRISIDEINDISFCFREVEKEMTGYDILF